MSIEPGSIWQHRKHDPENGRWHQYLVIDVTNPAETPSGLGVPLNVGVMFTAVHSETLDDWEVCGNSDGLWLYNYDTWATEPYVIYRATGPQELLNRQVWAQPLGMFADGRFTLVGHNSR